MPNLAARLRAQSRTRGCASEGTQIGQVFPTMRVGSEGNSIWESGEEESRGVSEVELSMVAAVQGCVSVHSAARYSSFMRCF